jgi:hypothetical protein
MKACNCAYTIIMDQHGRRYVVHTAPSGKNFMFNTYGGLTYVKIEKGKIK